MAKRIGRVSPLRSVVIPCCDAFCEDYEDRKKREKLLQLEWLQTNELGTYSSSTVVGCNTRRYHGLLVAATNPPVGRILGVSTVMEQLVIGEEIFDLAINEFDGAFCPHGDLHLHEFRDDAAATFVYKIKDVTVTKRVLLDEFCNGITVSYDIEGAASRLILRPFTTMRDFHSLRFSKDAKPICQPCKDGVSVIAVCEADGAGATKNLPPVQMWSRGGTFEGQPQWWYNQKYRVDFQRGQDFCEDIYSPGVFVCDVRGRRGKDQYKKHVVKLFASVGAERPKFKTTLTARRRRRNELALSVGSGSCAIRRLAAAADAFIVNRPIPAKGQGEMGASILAGYPWFADWGRDTFIALAGLLLCTGRFAVAERVFRTYAGSISAGMIPNRFDDYGKTPHYNSIDASLWFVVAAERYIQYSLAAGRERQAMRFWSDVLAPACEAILDGYRNGTRFGIHADTDGLITGGSRETQLTWMDAKSGDNVLTSRYGKAVEVNALWYCSHAWLGEIFRGLDDTKADIYMQRVRKIAESFVKIFWNSECGYLNDCVNDAGVDSTLRPNQILAVSLPHSPLTLPQQRGVVDVVREKLLTPLGLRTLCPQAPGYCGQYVGDSTNRDRAYHHGTVWAWLIGPFIEAYLKVENADDRSGGSKKLAARRAKKWLSRFDMHLDEGGIGSISEIFDGDAPHTPRGCFAQGWSVGEVLRAKMLVEAAIQNT